MTQNNVPKISIIIPSYNAEKYVARTIDSLIASTFSNWDCIIVDDGSTDKSVEIIQNYARKEPRLKLIQQPNRGVCNARNNGFKNCSSHSEYLMFLDADDCIDPQMLEVMIDYLEKYPHVGLACSDILYIDSQDRIIELPRLPRFFPSSNGGFEQVPDDIPEIPFFAVAAGVVKEPGTVLRRSVYTKTDGWSEYLGQGCEGNDLFMQMAFLSDCHFIPKKLFRYRQHDTQSHKLVDYKTHKDKLINKWKQKKGLTSEQQVKLNQVLEYLPAYQELLLAHNQSNSIG